MRSGTGGVWKISRGATSIFVKRSVSSINKVFYNRKVYPDVVHDIQDNIDKQIIDVDMMENNMKEMNQDNDDLIQLEDAEYIIQQQSSIRLEKHVISKWIEAAQMTAGKSCSITKLIKILRKATEPIYTLSVEKGK